MDHFSEPKPKADFTPNYESVAVRLSLDRSAKKPRGAVPANWVQYCTLPSGNSRRHNTLTVGI